MLTESIKEAQTPLELAAGTLRYVTQAFTPGEFRQRPAAGAVAVFRCEPSPLQGFDCPPAFPDGPRLDILADIGALTQDLLHRFQ